MEDRKICVFVGRGGMVVKMVGGRPTLPLRGEVEGKIGSGGEVVRVHAGGRELEAVNVGSWECDGEYRVADFRPLYFSMERCEFEGACKAKQMAYWERVSRYCPECGARMEGYTDIARRCVRCGHESYPPIATAIIVRVERGEDEILMVRARNFRGDHYGLVAGFVETNETLEECVRREVREETGLEIGDIRYAGSQPWPFPSGLMVGFVARYVSGEIRVQEEELLDAGFFRRGALPKLPDEMSIARRLIDEWSGRG